MKQALIAVGVFAALLVVVLVTRDRGGNVNVGVPKLELPVVNATQMTAIELSGAQTVSLKKDVNGWTVAGPSKAFHAADEAQVSALREALSQLKAGDFVTDRAQRQPELELDEGKALQVKVFTGAAAPALDVMFGKAGKLGGTYLRAPKSDAVFLTKSAVVHSIRRDANAWRKRAFFPAPVDQFSRLRVMHEDGSAFELESKPEGWALSTPAPAGFRFDPARAAQLAAALARTSALDFVDGAGTFTTAVKLEAELKDGEKVTLALGPGSAPEKMNARVDGDPQVYVVDGAQLNKRLVDLRDTHLVSFDPAKAQKLVVHAGGKKTVVAKDGASWKLVEPKAAGIEFDPARVTAQLVALKSIAAVRVEDVPEAKAGLAKPTAMIEVLVEGAPAQTVKFGGATPQGELYVKGSVDGQVYAIDPGVRARWEAGPELFKKVAAPPMPHGMSGVQGLENLPPEIRAQLEAQLRQQQQQ